MKITKRILAVLLLAALLVSCLLISVSAEDPFKAEGISDVEDVMEYYDLEDYVADNYEDGTWDAESYAGTGSEVVADPANENNKVLKVTGRSDKYSKAAVTDRLVVSFDIRYDASMKGQYKVDVKMVDNLGVESLTYNTMFSVNAGAGLFQYSVWDASLNNGEGGFVVTDFAGITPVADTWYNVVVFFNAEEGSYNFKISADGKESWVYSESYSLGSTEKLISVELKPWRNTDSRNDTIFYYLDNVEVYSGSFERNPANKNNITAQTIIDLDALYVAEDTDFDTKIRIALVLEQLVNKYGYTPEEGTPEIEKVNAIIAKAPSYINRAFAEALVTAASSIDTSIGYYGRLQFVEDSAYYSDSLPANENLATAPAFSEDPALVTAVVAARTVFDLERADLELVAEESTEFVKLMNTYNPDSKDYDGYLKGFYEAAIKFTKCDLTYAEEIEGVEDFGMPEAAAIFGEFVAKYTKLSESATAFITGAKMMQEALEEMATSTPREPVYEEAFGKLSEGYLICDAVYNGGDIDENLDEATYAELYALFSVYLDNKDSIVEQIEACVVFLDIIKKAQTATYYTAIIEHLAAAEECIDLVREKYQGVPEALAIYNALSEAVKGVENASDAYIKAVEAVVAATTFEAKQAAIEAALALKADGDVVGIAGVKDANIALSREMTAIETIISSSALLKTLVAELENAKTFTERRALLARASVAAANAEASLEGVADAIEKYNSFVEEYNNTISAMNATHAAATEKAVDLAGAASDYAGVYKAADIIKELVD